MVATVVCGAGMLYAGVGAGIVAISWDGIAGSGWATAIEAIWCSKLMILVFFRLVLDVGGVGRYCFVKLFLRLAESNEMRCGVDDVE